MSIENQNFHRSHGLQYPFDSLQIFTWFLISLPIIIFYFFQYPLLNGFERNFLHFLFILFYILGILLFIIATLTNHKTPIVIEVEQTHYCKYCQTNVPLSSKHCRICNKCRYGFDHHCRYINNCVTSENYFYFFYGSLFLMSTSIISHIYLIFGFLKFLKFENDINLILKNYYNYEISNLFIWILFLLSLIINLSIGIPMLILILYHIYFQHRGITTFQYLMDDLQYEIPKLPIFSCLSISNPIYPL